MSHRTSYKVRALQERYILDHRILQNIDVYSAMTCLYPHPCFSLVFSSSSVLKPFTAMLAGGSRGFKIEHFVRFKIKSSLHSNHSRYHRLDSHIRDSLTRPVRSLLLS